MAKDRTQVEDREIVVPGQVLAEGLDFLPSGKAVREGGNVISTVIGLANIKGRVIKVIPLTGKYSAKKNDSVIGDVYEISKYGWKVNIGTGQDAEINVRDASTSFIDANSLERVYKLGDVVLANVIEVGNSGIKMSTKFRPHGKLSGGIVIDVPSAKIPRIIGREGSMIKMVKEESGCDIFVGQNGLVWIRGGPESIVLARKAIDKICSDSHTKGLTDEVKKIFGKKPKKVTKKKEETKSKSKGGKK